MHHPLVGYHKESSLRRNYSEPQTNKVQIQRLKGGNREVQRCSIWSLALHNLKYAARFPDVVAASILRVGVLVLMKTIPSIMGSWHGIIVLSSFISFVLSEIFSCFLFLKEGIPVRGLEFRWKVLKKKLNLDFDEIRPNQTKYDSKGNYFQKKNKNIIPHSTTWIPRVLA